MNDITFIENMCDTDYFAVHNSAISKWLWYWRSRYCYYEITRKNAPITCFSMNAINSKFGYTRHSRTYVPPRMECVYAQCLVWISFRTRTSRIPLSPAWCGGLRCRISPWYQHRHTSRTCVYFTGSHRALLFFHYCFLHNGPRLWFICLDEAFPIAAPITVLIDR